MIVYTAYCSVFDSFLTNPVTGKPFFMTREYVQALLKSKSHKWYDYRIREHYVPACVMMEKI